MGRLLRFLNVGGALTAGIGGVLALVALVKGREARSLRGVISVDNLTELKHLLNLVPVIIAVTGRVWAPKPVKCNLSDGEGAIVEVRPAFTPWKCSTNPPTVPLPLLLCSCARTRSLNAAPPASGCRTANPCARWFEKRSGR